MRDPSGSRRIAGIFARHDMALELICGADFPGIVSSGASSGDRNMSYGRNRPPVHAPPTQKSTAEPSPEHDWVDTRNHTAKAASAIGRGAPRDRPDPQGPANAKTNSRNQEHDWLAASRGPPRSTRPAKTTTVHSTNQDHDWPGPPGSPKSTGTPRTQHHTTKDVLGAHA